MSHKGFVFRNARVFDGDSPDLNDVDVVVKGGRITRVAPRMADLAEGFEVINCAGSVLMPGLIDAHVHVYAASLNLGRMVNAPSSYLAHFAAQFLQSSLQRGFTTLRDVGGGDVGLGLAIRDGLLTATPRLFYGGRVISQTGGHGDMRSGEGGFRDDQYCCCHVDGLAVIADGADAVRKAVREELRRGASHVKIMASGGVASPTDPLERCQYSDGEIAAAVEEAARAGSYVAAHCHPAEAVRRSAALGVRSIEHATLIDRETAEFVAGSGSYTVPTLVIIAALVEEGAKLGFPQVSMDKLARLSDRALGGLTIMKDAGVKMGFGTDLLGNLHVRQSEEFTLRAQVLTPLDILRSVTSVNAELMGKSGELGCIREGAAADLLVVKGNPLEDVAVLASGGKDVAMIMKDGKFYKR
jgi:imidazolonepropionase-like amidohydrolase